MEVAFGGQGSSPARAEAKKKAIRDLFTAVARYVRADVQSSFEATEVLSQKGGVEKQSFAARSEVRAQLGDTVERLDAAKIYWEQVATPGRGTIFRYYVHAKVPRDKILRGATLSQLKRGTLVVIQPYASSPAELGEVLRADLSDRLSGHVGFNVCPSFLVEQALPKRIEDYTDAIYEHLGPSILIELWVRERDGRIAVRYVVRDPSVQVPPVTGEIERPAPELFELQDALVTAVTKDLTAALRALGELGSGGVP